MNCPPRAITVTSTTHGTARHSIASTGMSLYWGLSRVLGFLVGGMAPQVGSAGYAGNSRTDVSGDDS